MGSTVVAFVVRSGKATATNIGDSRLYLLRAGTLTQLSVDHSWAGEQIRQGADAATVRADGRSHMLTQALGVKFEGEPPVVETAIEDGDVLLLCSDGLHGVVPDGEIGRTLASGPDVNAVADRLMALALDAGAPDNVTVVVAKYVAG